MKHKKLLIPFLIIIFVLISACAPVIETAEEPSETPTVVLETSTATQSREPTATRQPTVTKTPEATPTPEATSVSEIDRPTQLIDELIPEGSPLREDFYPLMKAQFENGGLQFENGHYTLYCIATEDMHIHEPFIELPDGSIVTHSIPCQYFDAEGNEQIVYIPAVRFKENEKLIQFLGFQPVSNDPAYEGTWDLMSYGLAKDMGPINFVDNHGYVGAGHPFTLHFGPVEPDQVQAFASEVQAEIQANPEVFADAGNPAGLYQQLLFPWIQVGFRNNFVRHVE